MLKTIWNRYRFIGGFLVGSVFPVLGAVLEISNQNLPFALRSFVTVQRGNHLFWVIDAAPFVLSILAQIIGTRQYRLKEMRDNLEILVSERTEEVRTAYQAESIINALLNLSLKALSLEEMLERALTIVLKIPWLPASPSGGIFLFDDESHLHHLQPTRS